MRSIFALLPIALLAACSTSASEPDEGVSESEFFAFDAQDCPRELRVRVSYVFLAPGTSIDAHEGGSTLNAAERERLDAAVKELKDLKAGPMLIEAPRTVMTPDACTYALGSGMTAVIRNGHASGSRLEITTRHLIISEDAKRIAPEGIRFWDVDSSVALAIVSAPGRPLKALDIGAISVDVIGDQIARFPSLSALRLPVLDRSLLPLHERDANQLSTVVVDVDKGPMKYVRFAQGIESATDSELVSHAPPTAFQTTDPDTTMCFLGPAHGVCQLLGWFSGTVFSDGFQFTGAGCRATESEVTMTYRSATSTSYTPSSTMVVPRCQ